MNSIIIHSLQLKLQAAQQHAAWLTSNHEARRTYPGIWGYTCAKQRAMGTIVDITVELTEVIHLNLHAAQLELAA